MKNLDIPTVITPTPTLPPQKGEGNSRVSGWAPGRIFQEEWGKGRGDGIKILLEVRFELAKVDSKINIIRKRKSTKVRVLKEDRRDEYSE